jgi:pSer/pThr/pTyr-binding forkhead associated (FHA) protein
MELKLVVLAGAKEGLEIPLKKDKFLIGRAKDCALRAGSEAISRRHCAIIRVKDKWAVKDLGSRNGTYVNDKRITEPVRLNAGDELSVGPLKFRVASVPAAKTEAAPAKATAPSSAVVGKPRKQPPVKDVSDVVERTRSRSDDSASEEDITRWLLGVPDNDTAAETLKETRTIRLEETKAHGRFAPPDQGTVADVSDVAESAAEEDSAAVDESTADDSSDEKKSGWNLFNRGKGTSKPKPGKLPPRPEAASKDSRAAAADILREMTRRR